MKACEDDLLARATQGDTEALSVLLRRHGPHVRQTLSIRRKWQSVLDADDVMQVTYLEAALRIRSVTLTRASAFTAWLQRIAENNLRDAIKELERDKRPQNRVVEPSGAESRTDLMERLRITTSTPSRKMSAREVQQLIEVALQRLPPDYRTVLQLFELKGHSGLEVAAIMGRSQGAVKMLLARARDRLAEILGSSSGLFDSRA